DSFGRFRQSGDNRKNWTVAGLVFVSFSAFDEFDLPKTEPSEMRATMVGLRLTVAPQDDQSQNESVSKSKGKDSSESLASQLTRNFRSSFEKCRVGLRRERWRTAIETLENDPLFAEAEITTLLELSDNKWQQAAEGLFRQLSSGHAIV